MDRMPEPGDLTAASLMAQSGVPVTAAAAALGHDRPCSFVHLRTCIGAISERGRRDRTRPVAPLEEQLKVMPQRGNRAGEPARISRG